MNSYILVSAVGSPYDYMLFYWFWPMAQQNRAKWEFQSCRRGESRESQIEAMEPPQEIDIGWSIIGGTQTCGVHR